MVKIGKSIETCVLYVDIRNSVELTKKHHSITMAKIYTALIKAVIKIGRHHGASTRNIIGDRVMLVFPTHNCFQNAVACAISINHIATKIINKKFAGVDFSCGIGIDHGKLKVIKVGIQRNGTEHSENKGLVWTGYPANLASRLTDLANKKIESVTYKVNYNAFKNRYPDMIGLTSMLDNYGILGAKSARITNNTPYNYIPTEEVWDESKFAASISFNKSGTLEFNEGKLNSMERLVNKIKYPAILITQAVLDGLKAETTSVIRDGWKEQPGKIRDITQKVYGSDFTWDL